MVTAKNLTLKIGSESDFLSHSPRNHRSPSKKLLSIDIYARRREIREKISIFFLLKWKWKARRRKKILSRLSLRQTMKHFKRKGIKLYRNWNVIFNCLLLYSDRKATQLRRRPPLLRPKNKSHNLRIALEALDSRERKNNNKMPFFIALLLCSCSSGVYLEFRLHIDILAFYIISIYKHCIKNENQHEMETTTT